MPREAAGKFGVQQPFFLAASLDLNSRHLLKEKLIRILPLLMAVITTTMNGGDGDDSRCDDDMHAHS